ncbi:MAG TPA: GGDEF domain-containing protein [Candidatus Omnitrophota bacterium]|nr:GGDEF domain-containing protein [Candidatus Omnitrophota bacterium]
MKILFLKTRFIGYILLLSVISWLMFNFLLSAQSRIMHKYFIEKPTSYNLERAERLASSIYKSFKSEVTDLSTENIRTFVERYDSLPFLSVNFIYNDDTGGLVSVLRSVKEVDILSAEYVYPIRQGTREVGTLLVYDINREYKKGLEEYNQMLAVTRIFFGSMLLLLTSLLVYREYGARISEEKRKAEYHAVHDGLTGLYTHKYFKQHLERELSRSRRYKSPVSLIMCDIDNFKKFNDSYGHLAGDKALKSVAGIILSNVRSSDIVARYGGEEFAILLVESGLEEAQSVARRLKSLTDETVEIASRIKGQIERKTIPVDHTTVRVTMSMGISCYDGEKDCSPEDLIRSADTALYRSKDAGRNRITLHYPETGEFESFS